MSKRDAIEMTQEEGELIKILINGRGPGGLAAEGGRRQNDEGDVVGFGSADSWILIDKSVGSLGQ